MSISSMNGGSSPIGAASQKSSFFAKLSGVFGCIKSAKIHPIDSQPSPRNSSSSLRPDMRRAATSVVIKPGALTRGGKQQLPKHRPSSSPAISRSPQPPKTSVGATPKSTVVAKPAKPAKPAKSAKSAVRIRREALILMKQKQKQRLSAELTVCKEDLRNCKDSQKIKVLMERIGALNRESQKVNEELNALSVRSRSTSAGVVRSSAPARQSSAHLVFDDYVFPDVPKNTDNEGLQAAKDGLQLDELTTRLAAVDRKIKQTPSLKAEQTSLRKQILALPNNVAREAKKDILNKQLIEFRQQWNDFHKAIKTQQTAKNAVNSPDAREDIQNKIEQLQIDAGRITTNIMAIEENLNALN